MYMKRLVSTLLWGICLSLSISAQDKIVPSLQDYVELKERRV